MDEVTKEPLVGRQGGSQTLARGLLALVAITESADGLSVQQLAQHLGVHRSIAYRVAQTLVDFGFVAVGTDKLYRPGARLAALAESYLPSLRATAQPFMRRLADEVGCTVSLFVQEGDSAVAVATTEPTTVTHHLRFRAGMRTPIDRGAAGYALLALHPPQPDDPTAVVRARRDGFAISHGEVEPGAHAIAAGVSAPGVRVCLNVMTYVEDQAWEARDLVGAAAAELSAALAESAAKWA